MTEAVWTYAVVVVSFSAGFLFAVIWRRDK